MAETLSKRLRDYCNIIDQLGHPPLASLLAEAATELEALRKRCKAVEARLESVRQDVLEFYDAIPDLPITTETADAATDVLTKFCIDFQPIMEAAAQEPSHG